MVEFVGPSLTRHVVGSGRVWVGRVFGPFSALFVSGQNFRPEPSHALIGPDWVFFERVSSGLSGRVTRDQVYGACPNIYYRAQFHPKPAQHMNQVSYFRADRVRFVGFGNRD